MMPERDSSKRSLTDRLAVMRQPHKDPDAAFYAFTFTATDEGQIICGTQTQWVGFADAENSVELREASTVSLRMAEMWSDLGQPFVFVRHADDLVVFLAMGGNALVIPRIAEKAFPRLLKPMPSLRDGRSGFASAYLLGPHASRRAPTPKLRMTTLIRDRRRCRICGRNPDNHVDLELHVHHIRPWKNGGATHIGNLITLCQTCHKGLDPHFDASLFEYLEGNDAPSKDAKFLQEVLNYQRAVGSDFPENRYPHGSPIPPD